MELNVQSTLRYFYNFEYLYCNNGTKVGWVSVRYQILVSLLLLGHIGSTHPLLWNTMTYNSMYMVKSWIESFVIRRSLLRSWDGMKNLPMARQLGRLWKVVYFWIHFEFNCPSLSECSFCSRTISKCSVWNFCTEWESMNAPRKKVPSIKAPLFYWALLCYPHITSQCLQVPSYWGVNSVPVSFYLLSSSVAPVLADSWLHSVVVILGVPQRQQWECPSNSSYLLPSLLPASPSVAHTTQGLFFVLFWWEDGR